MFSFVRDRVYNDLLANYGVIHCIGDSHVSFLSGQRNVQPRWPERSNDKTPLFKTYRVGPSLAYNLCEEGTTTRGRESLFSILEIIPPGSTVMLCFGEIDCRFHLLKQAELQKRNVLDLVKDCVERYFAVIQEVQEKGYKVMVWNVVPPAPDSAPVNPEFPTYGTSLERGYVTRGFNDYLNDLCKELSIPFVSVFEKLMDSKGKIKKRLFMDQVHLSPGAIPYVLQELYGEKGKNVYFMFYASVVFLSSTFFNIAKNVMNLPRSMAVKAANIKRHLLYKSR